MNHTEHIRIYLQEKLRALFWLGILSLIQLTTTATATTTTVTLLLRLLLYRASYRAHTLTMTKPWHAVVWSAPSNSLSSITARKLHMLIQEYTRYSRFFVVDSHLKQALPSLMIHVYMCEDPSLLCIPTPTPSTTSTTYCRCSTSCRWWLHGEVSEQRSEEPPAVPLDRRIALQKKAES